MAASFNPVSDQTWYADSRATNHITHDLDNLPIHSGYQGNDKVPVGNGQGLSILNTGSSSIHTPSSSFHLNNILHVPAIPTNLLYVNQFTKDNCFFVFDSTGFSIQEQSSEKILFRGSSKNGMYPFPSSTCFQLLVSYGFSWRGSVRRCLAPTIGPPIFYNLSTHLLCFYCFTQGFIHCSLFL